MADTLTVFPKDYDALSLFLSGFENETKSKDAWLNLFRLWWDINPTFTDDTQRGWILSENGKIVGFIGCIPSFFQLGGKRTTVFTITTWNVLPEYRSQSIDLLLKIMDATKDSLLFDTTPTEVVAKILISFDFQPLPGYQNRNSLIVIDHKIFLASKLADDVFGRMSGKAVAPISKTFQSLCIRGLRKKGVREVKELLRPDSAFDRLWERTKHLYTNTNIRAADIIQWHCFENQNLKKTLLGCYEQDNLLGYLIAGSETSKQLRMLKCFDLWIDPSQTGVLESLLNYTAQFARNNSCELVVLPHFTKLLGSHYHKLGLLQGRRKEVREVVKINLEFAAAITKDNSYFVELQGDRGMF
jgi:hypothetical protein